MAGRKHPFSNKIQYVLARVLFGAIRSLPVPVAYRLGQSLGWCCWRLLKKRRVTVRANLSVIYSWIAQRSGDAKPSNEFLEQRVRELFIRNGANLLAGFPFGDLTPDKMERHVEFIGRDELAAAAAEGNGVIMLLGHMGPWEVLTCMRDYLGKHGVDVVPGAMYRALNNQLVDDWYKGQRERMGAELFSRKDGFHKPVDFLRSGGMLGILADQKMRQGEEVSFFGQPAKTTPIPGLFQRRSGAPICVLSVETIAPARWRFVIRRVELPGAAETLDREAFAVLCNQALERSLSKSPTDGFWFSRRFAV
ncbi:lysophospholipid acyltransferase family protein [Coraliomargarita akajimensis]|uniref:Lipid A biosynthesis acyltransferase n=1 Tax=Coraliomargarita akajimensis (strain DSM 45221 / IAM 15411 / JCM 23193 / KCTC 12865 / 04OKA010-24) TaxID=583355 RepID=D5EP44_CORAD|nr:lysophospholipid acyltransferase family protein [Coraliomargarita akajimensis]ADE55554.1 lipid A biosynthesis acyltransferase [Coraliomargarita akajimensis DSM 45221]